MKQTDYEKELIARRSMMKGYGIGEEEEAYPASDQDRGILAPPLFLEKGGEKVIPLPRNFDEVVKNNNIIKVMDNRKSRRLFDREESLTLQELAYLLWMTQGVKEVAGNAIRMSVRTVPSAGSRHALETYLYISRVEGLNPGLYHYLANEHKLEFLGYRKEQNQELSAAFLGQTYFAASAVAFIWTAIPYRMEWRYQEWAAKYILLDAGHMCQNLYLAGESLGCSVCAVGAYEQELADAFLGLEKKDGYQKEEEFVIYGACVGR